MRKNFNQKGYSLITLLVFMIIGLIITSAGAILIYHTNIAASDIELSEKALTIAESGIENAAIRLIRDPNYLGEDLTIGSGVATIIVTGNTEKTVTSIGRVGNFQRKVEALINNGQKLEIIQWKEKY